MKKMQLGAVICSMLLAGVIGSMAEMAGPLYSTAKRTPLDNNSSITVQKQYWYGIKDWIAEYNAVAHTSGSGVTYTFKAGKERSSVWGQMMMGQNGYSPWSCMKMYVTYTDGTQSAVIDGTKGTTFDIQKDYQGNPYYVRLLYGNFTKSSKGKLIKSITFTSDHPVTSALVFSRIGSSKPSAPSK